MNVIGQLSAIFILSQVGFVVALAGIVLAVGGYSLLRVTLFPIVFLLFAIPLPYFVDSVLTLQLQLVSSELGVFVIQLFQIPVYLDGNIIDLGTSRLLVAEACSGLRYLYPLLCLSFLAAYLFQAPIWQRVIVFLSAIPITIAMNGFRIGLVGILVSKWGAEQAEGLLHLFEGWVIFIACAAFISGRDFSVCPAFWQASLRCIPCPRPKKAAQASIGIDRLPTDPRFVWPHWSQPAWRSRWFPTALKLYRSARASQHFL